MVLLLTAMPVVPGLMLAELADIAQARASFSGTLVTLLVQATLCAIFLAGFVAAERVSHVAGIAQATSASPPERSAG